MNGWISVDDQLPPEGQKVLCCGTRQGLFIGQVCTFPHFYAELAKKTGMCDMDTGGSRRIATHWMPLPEPPK